MKTLTTALAVTAVLTASTVAKTERTREVHIQPSNSLSHNAVSSNHGNQINSYCRFEHRETDPDPRVRLQLARDCRWYEEDPE
jgi:hypothetical protein